MISIPCDYCKRIPISAKMANATVSVTLGSGRSGDSCLMRYPDVNLVAGVDAIVIEWEQPRHAAESS